MTAALALEQDERPAALPAKVAQLHRLIDDLQVNPPVTTDHAGAVREVDRAIRRLSALKLTLLAAANKARVAAEAGFAGTEAWVARQTTVSRSTAARDVALATDLTEGYDATAAALSEGLVSLAHAAVIVRVGEQLPGGVGPEQRAVVERTLVEKAQRFSPEQLRRIARRALEAVEPDQAAVDAHENDLVRSEEELARDKCALTMRDNGDGTTTGWFTVPTLAGAVLGKVIDAMTAPRRMREPGTDHFDWRHRRGLALAELLEHLSTDQLHPRVAATVIVTIDHTVLRGALKAAGLDTGQQISAGEARRLACGAGLIPAVLGGNSAVLDLGRQQRLFTDGQRTALAAVHTNCAADGCERPYAWCELHHRDPWSRGGRTDLREAVPLCHFHHRRIHDDAYLHRSLPDGSIRFSRRT